MLKSIAKNILDCERTSIETFLLICNEYKNIYNIYLIKYMRHMIINKYLKLSRKHLINKIRVTNGENKRYKNNKWSTIKWEYVNTIKEEIIGCVKNDHVTVNLKSATKSLPSDCKYGIRNFRILSGLEYIDCINLEIGELIICLNYKETITDNPFDIFNNALPFTLNKCLIIFRFVTDSIHCGNIMYCYDVVKIIEPVEKYLIGFNDVRRGCNIYIDKLYNMLFTSCYGIIFKIILVGDFDELVEHSICNIKLSDNNMTHLPFIQKTSNRWELDFGDGVYFGGRSVYNLVAESSILVHMEVFLIYKSSVKLCDAIVGITNYT